MCKNPVGLGANLTLAFIVTVPCADFLGMASPQPIAGRILGCISGTTSANSLVRRAGRTGSTAGTEPVWPQTHCRYMVEHDLVIEHIFMCMDNESYLCEIISTLK